MHRIIIITALFLLASSIAWGNLDSSNQIYEVNQIHKIHNGERIGLKFKRNSIQLNIDTHKKVFTVKSTNGPFSYNPGDKLIDIDFVDEKFILNETWTVWDISENKILLQNEVIHGKTKRHIIVEIDLNEISGFYISKDPLGEEFLYSYYLIVS